MSTVSERAQELLGFKFYNEPNMPEPVSEIELMPPQDRQYILRCPIRIPGSEMSVPDELTWCNPLIANALEYQEQVVKVDHPYTYLTVRHGLVTSESDDEWHVDGFSMKVPQIPEQNYVWTNHKPTEVTAFGLNIPADFDPLKHNLYHYIQDSMPEDADIQTLEERVLYAMDPYIFHRRPLIAAGLARTFIRLTFSPIAINDIHNYVNPAFGNDTQEPTDGVAEFRDKLLRYPLAA